MKRILIGVLQFVVFLVVFALGSFLPGANILLPMLSVAAGPGRIFVYDGLLLMLLLYALILLVSLARKRIEASWLASTVAVALALILGLAMKFGFKTV